MWLKSQKEKQQQRVQEAKSDADQASEELIKQAEQVTPQVHPPVEEKKLPPSPRPEEKNLCGEGEQVNPNNGKAELVVDRVHV